jgi:hypothetical protein
MMRAEFVTEGGLWPIGDGNWRVTHAFTVKAIEDSGTEHVITVPVGFETDLASVPRLPLVYIALAGKGPKSAVVHDYAYHEQMGKGFADDVFHALLVIEEGKETADILYAGVVVGGHHAYAMYGPNPPTIGGPGIEVSA